MMIRSCVLPLVLIAGGLVFADDDHRKHDLDRGQLDRIYKIRTEFQKRICDLQVKAMNELREVEARMCRELQEKIGKLRSAVTQRSISSEGGLCL
jgi:hypothetical protein